MEVGSNMKRGAALPLQAPDRWGERIIDRFPRDLQDQVRERWGRIANTGPQYPGLRHADGLAPYAKANLDLSAQWREAERERLHIAFDEAEIRERARRAAYLCLRMVRLELMQDHARSLGIEPPTVEKRVTRVGAARRLSSEHWWRRQMRKAYTRTAEAHLRSLGVVHKKRQVYASDRAVEHRRNRKVRDRALLQEMVAVSDAGDQLELWSIVEKSQANPALRRAELMTRLRGFEEVAQAAGHVAEFITLTCPSAYHRTHANGTANERWEGFTPRQGQQWLSKMWARARAKLARLSVFFYGFRIAEPHHDGTPHWHAVLFSTVHGAEALRTVLRGVWLSEYASEPGADRVRSDFKQIDFERGSAAGYLAKYVAKNIDGHDVGDDYETEGQPATESCDRVAAWASAHGIRQFQQLGGPPVAVWREVRRLRDRVVSNAAIEAAREAADAGQWADFVTALGGIYSGRRADVRLWSECTGELNQYDELRGPQIAGVRAMRYAYERASSVFKALPLRRYERDGRRFTRRTMSRRLRTRIRLVANEQARIRTREKIWRIQRKNASGLPAVVGETGNKADVMRRPHSSLGPVSITVRGSKTVPGEWSTGAPRSGSTRGSPWMH